MSVSSPPAARPLTGRTALVTGGASGIGHAVAGRLAADGAHVLVLDRDEHGAKEVAGAVDGEHLVADLSDGASIAYLALDTRGIDILVNNAGIQHVAPVEEFDPDRFALIHRGMLHAPFLLARWRGSAAASSRRSRPSRRRRSSRTWCGPRSRWPRSAWAR